MRTSALFAEYPADNLLAVQCSADRHTLKLHLYRELSVSSVV